MLEERPQNRFSISSACVADVEQLCAQLRTAISALSSDDIDSLEHSVVELETLVNRVQDDLFCDTSSAADTPQKFPDFKQLSDLTRIYATLLSSSMRTAGVRAALCRSFEPATTDRSSPGAASGLSWEV